MTRAFLNHLRAGTRVALQYALTPNEVQPIPGFFFGAGWVSISGQNLWGIRSQTTLGVEVKTPLVSINWGDVKRGQHEIVVLLVILCAVFNHSLFQQICADSHDGEALG